MVSRRLGVLVSALAVFAGCRAIAGLQDLTYKAPDAGCAPIVLPTGDGGAIRLVNAGAVGEGADFCVRPTGASSWGAPVFHPAANAPSCSAGLAYAQATVPFTVTSTTIDVKAIKVGDDCDAPSTSEHAAIAVGPASSGVKTILRMGGQGAEQIVALSEDLATSNEEGRIRVVNALSGTTTINVGTPVGTVLPTTVPTPMLTAPIAPGQTASSASTASPGQVDANGYLITPAEPVTLGVVAAAQTDALFVVQTTTQPLSPSTGSVYAIGVPGGTPAVRGLYCTENGAAPSGSPSNAITAPCSLSALATLGVDTWNVELKGAVSDYEAERRPYVLQDIAARSSDDVMCLLEVARQSDKELVAEAGAPRYPYTYAPQTDLDTPFDDPAMADGGLPPVSTAPPCSGVDPTDVANAFACFATSCSTTGDATGTLISTTDCLSANCFRVAAPLYHSGPAQNACLDCMIYELSSFETIAAAQATCTTDSHQPFAFEGQTPSMILSRYPLLETRTYQLPSTGWRRVVLYAKVQLEDQAIDFYCAHLSDRNNGPSLAYVGNYGFDQTTNLDDGGTSFVSGWEMEQDLQVQRAIAFIRTNSGSTGLPAIITGDWHASTLASAPDGGVVTDDLSPEVMQALDEVFVRAEPAGFTGECTWCPPPQNPYNDGSPRADFVRPYVQGFQSGATSSDDAWGTDLFPILGDVDEAPPPGGMGPASFFYAKSVRLVRPPVAQ